MKKWILAVTGLLGTVLAVSAQGIVFFHGTYEEALKKAETENKHIFVDIYTSWCGPCKMMAREVFSRPEVGEYFNNHYVCLKLDAEKEKEHVFFDVYQPRAYPTFFWLDAQGRLLDVQTGYREPAKFLELAVAAGSSDLYRQLEAGKARWEAGERTPELVREYVLGVLDKVAPEQVTPLIGAYFQGLPEEQLRTEENYCILSRFMMEAGDNVFFRILMRYADVYQHYEQGDEFWIRMYRMAVRAGILLRNEPEKYQAYVDFLHRLDSPLAGMYTEVLAMEHMLFHKDFQRGIPEAMVLAEKYRQHHSYLPGQFFYTLIIAGFFKEEQVEALLADQVIALAEEALRVRPSRESLLYLSVAYARKGDYRKAYELMASAPFLPEPVLSNALYKHLNLPVIRKESVRKKVTK